MNKLTNTYKGVLGEALLGEERIDFNNLTDNIILVDSEDSIVLIDKSTLKIPKRGKISIDRIIPSILGVVTYEDMTSDTIEIVTIAAEKGYGLLMYELMMQKSYPKGIVSSRDGNTKQGAFRLYQYYYEGLNPNVKVEKIEPNDKNYIPCLNGIGSNIPCKEDGITPLNPKFTNLYNSILYMKPNEYNWLKRRGDVLLNLYGKSFEKVIVFASSIYFDTKYL